MIGMTNANGGGGTGGFNLQFVSGMIAPSNPKENMIWVKTDRAITQFLISKSIGAWSGIAGAVEMTYEASDDYMTTGISTLFFDGKLRGLYGQAWFKPTALYQSNGIIAEPKDAYIYKSGTWVQFSWTIVYLYNRGVLNNAVTGGINIVKKGISENGYTRNTPKVTYNSDNFVITNGGTDYNDGGIVHFANKIDLTSYKTLGFEGQCSGGYCTLCIWPSFGKYILDNNVASIPNTGNLDISALSGAFYIGFGIYGRDGNKDTVYSVSLQ